MAAAQSADPLSDARRALAERRYRDAHAAAMRLLQRNPRDAEAFHILGRIALDNRTFDKAADLFDRAGRIQPAARHYAAAARSLIGLNRHDAARAAADRALALGLGDAETWDNLGVVLSRLGRQAEARDCFARAVAADPGQANYANNLAWAHQFLGEMDAADAAYRQAIALDPDFDRAYAAVVRLARQTPRNSLTEPMAALFERSAGDPERRLRLGHALAKSFEDLGDSKAALDWLVRGKAGMLARSSFDLGAIQRLFEAAAETAPQSPLPDPGPGGPVFVLGLPRSGTTLVDRILSSHPDLVSAAEPMTFPLLAHRMSGAPAKALFSDEVFLRSAGLDLERLGRDYLTRTRPMAGGAARFIDKTPLDFLYCGLIARALPDARIICLRRDPVDSCLAMFRQLFAADFDHYDFTLSLDHTARYYVLFDRLMAHWRETLPPSRFTEVAYEALVRDQEAQTRRLVAFCGLAWDDRCLAPQDNAAPVTSASAAQVREAVHDRSIGRWRDYGEGLDPLLAVLRAEGLERDDFGSNRSEV